jgi:hypothetical protein
MLKEKFGFYFSTIQVEKECAEIDEAEDIDIMRAKERRQTFVLGCYINWTLM